MPNLQRQHQGCPLELARPLLSLPTPEVRNRKAHRCLALADSRAANSHLTPNTKLISPMRNNVSRWLFLRCLVLLPICIAGCSESQISLEDLEAAAAKIEPEAAPVTAGGEADAAPVVAEVLDIEKTDLKFGFIKLTDCAPLVIAKEKGYFDDEGLNVEVEAQSNWKVLLDRVIDGQLDGAHMLAGQPIGATIGFGTPAHVITAYSLDYNGNGITVSNDIWKQMQENDESLKSETPQHPIPADALKPIVDQYKQEGKDFNMGMVFPVSTHNYEIRYWLAGAGIHPGFYTKDNITGMVDADVLLSVTPPPQMPATLEAGTILGYCVGEPWNQQAVVKGIGVPVTTNYDIWKNNPEKGLRRIR